MKGLRPPPLPAGESALLVDDSELIEDEAPATPETPAASARTEAVEARVTGLTARAAGGRELDVTFLSEVYLFADFDLDIAVGGLFIPTYTAFELGERLELCLEFGEQVVRASAEVRWALGDRRSPQQRPGFALFWHELEDETLSALERYCRLCPPRFYEL